MAVSALLGVTLERSALWDASFATGAVLALLASLYYYLLPKPIEGIPYNRAATGSVLGDIPAMVREGNNNSIAWIGRQAANLPGPLCQLFIIPFAKPVVVLTDYHEAQDILMRRKEFDRSDYSIALVGGAVPNHHVNIKTGSAWKAHRQLVGELMTSKFLNGVAAKNLYDSALNLIALWDAKAQKSAGRAFAVEQDIYYTALDATLDFAFGSSYPDRALPAQIQAAKAAQPPPETDYDATAPVDFTPGPVADVIVAILQACTAINEVANLGFVALGWWWKLLQPKEKQVRAVRRKFLKEQVAKSTEKLRSNADREDDGWVTSAVDSMVLRECATAEKEAREPVFWSEMMHDEILGFVIAGHDTSSTSLCWGVKFMTDHPRCQETLRKALRSAYKSALAEKRSPSCQEIAKSNIPYLDAVVEEIVRLSHTVALVDRQCAQDTVVLGHPIPKGTTVMMPVSGPSLTQPRRHIDPSLRSESSRANLEEKGMRTWPEDDINSFRPERWLTGDGIFDGSAGPTLAFSMGVRACWGRKLAYLEMKMVLTMILWNFELQPCPPNLSSYDDVQGLTRAPKYCYVRPKRVLL